MSIERPEFEVLLERMFQSGQINVIDKAVKLAEFDAALATRDMAKYSLESIIVAAASAIASASAAYFAYTAVQVPH